MASRSRVGRSSRMTACSPQMSIPAISCSISLAGPKWRERRRQDQALRLGGVLLRHLSRARSPGALSRGRCRPGWVRPYRRTVARRNCLDLCASPRRAAAEAPNDRCHQRGWARSEPGAGWQRPDEVRGAFRAVSRDRRCERAHPRHALGRHQGRLRRRHDRHAIRSAVHGTHQHGAFLPH